MSTDQPWAPDLGAHRLLSDGRTTALLRPDATVDWWCAPDPDDAPLCWQLLDRDGGVAGFEGADWVDADDAPAGATTRTVLRTGGARVEVRDGLLAAGSGVVLVRLLRWLPGRAPVPSPTAVDVVHLLRAGGFDAPPVEFTVAGGTARGVHRSRGAERGVTVRADAHEVVGGVLRSVVRLEPEGTAVVAVVVGADAELDLRPAALAERLAERDAQERRHLDSARLPRRHPARARDALAVIRACTHHPTGAVVAAPTTSLPEAPGHDRQFDYRYTWLRDASLSTAVAALLGRPEEARHHLALVHRGWGDHGLLERPLLDVRGGPVPAEREVDGVAGWAGSLPVRVGNGAKDQRQYDAVGLLVEAVSVHVQVGGRLETPTWDLVRRLADDVARDEPGTVKQSNGIWELRGARPLVDGDVGRWLVLDRALWIARGWRPWTRRRHWRAARDTIARRVLSSFDERGLLPQAYDDGQARPDASALMVVAFGMLDGDDPRAGRLVDALLDDLGAGPFVYRYPPGGHDGFSGREGAFLPVSFLAVTALAALGRVEEARDRLDRLCASLPRLLSEEVDPQTGRLLGNTPLVWSHAELARALYVLDAAEREDRWGSAGLWAWRLSRYVALRASLRS